MVNIVSFSYTLSVQMYGFLSKPHNFANDFRHTAHIYAIGMHIFEWYLARLAGGEK